METDFNYRLSCDYKFCISKDWTFLSFSSGMRLSADRTEYINLLEKKLAAEILNKILISQIRKMYYLRCQKGEYMEQGMAEITGAQQMAVDFKDTYIGNQGHVQYFHWQRVNSVPAGTSLVGIK